MSAPLSPWAPCFKKTGPFLAWAHLELGELNQTEQTVARALARARPENLQLVAVDALRVHAMVALRRKRWEDAAASLEEGIALARGMPYPYAEVRSLDPQGQLPVHPGDPAAVHPRLGYRVTIPCRLRHS